MPHKSSRPAGDQNKTLAIDIGGSGIKAIVLNQAGVPISERSRIETPQPATPAAVLEAISTVVEGQGNFDHVSVGFPGVVRNGVTETAANLSSDWIGFALSDALGALCGKPVRAANDADIQGFGAIRGHGVEVVITLGTGFGSALFVDGRLVPNLEIAHHLYRKGKTYEDALGKPALKEIGKQRWNRRLGGAVQSLIQLFNYDHLYIGGGNSKHVSLDLPENVHLIPNVAGLLGGVALWRD